jgi:transglutaminase-like putative cysteine protease
VEAPVKSRIALQTLLLALLLAVPLFAASKQFAKPSRTFEFTYTATIHDIPQDANLVRIWIPVASSGAHQSVTVKSISAPVPVRVTRIASSGDHMLYAQISRPRVSTEQFKIVYDVTRGEYSKGNYASLMRFNGDPVSWSPSLARYLQPNRLVPTGGLIKQIADTKTRGEEGEIEKAYTLYNYVFHTMRYDKSGTGWGRGDAVWACDAHHGNCTDFHSLFMALARSQKIPVRFSIGFPLPRKSTEGVIPGYHCWAEFYVRSVGWVPVDISEAWLTPSLHDFFFGSLDADRVLFSTGRDLTLRPPQAGPPINYFIYAYVEVDGRSFASVDRKFSFRNLDAKGNLGNQR